MDRNVINVARKALKKFHENLMNTEGDVFFIENNDQKIEYYCRAMKTRNKEICKRQLKIVQNRQMKSVHPYILFPFS